MEKKYYIGHDQIKEFLYTKEVPNYMRVKILIDVLEFENCHSLTAQLCQDEEELGFILDGYDGEENIMSNTYWIEDYEE